jgi:hypothetical protein
VFPPAAIAALYECIGRCALRLKARANGGTHANGHEFVYRRPTWARRIARPRNFDGCDELSRPMKFAPSDHGRSGLFTQSARFEANREGARAPRAATLLSCRRVRARLNTVTATGGAWWKRVSSESVRSPPPGRADMSLATVSPTSPQPCRRCLGKYRHRREAASDRVGGRWAQTSPPH